MNLNKYFFKYFVYYPVVILRGEWIYPHLKKLRETQYFTKHQIEQLQLKRFNKLLACAKQTTEYYENKIPSAINILSEMGGISFLEKDSLRESGNQLISKSAVGRITKKTTGGSTGAAVTIAKNNRAMAEELAATWRGYEWAGIDIGERQARFWGVPLEKKNRRRAALVDFVTNRTRLSAFSFSDADLSSYVDLLVKKPPEYFYGYVSMIKQFAEYIDKYSINLPFKIKAVITTSEVLSPVDREYISGIFKCPVFNEYGCGEIGTIAHECEYGSMHITAENMIVEIVDEQGNILPDGKLGEIVVTDLTNLAMPLIRYKMRDFGFLSSDSCKCGRGLPILKEVCGREYDILINRHGQKFHGEFFLYMVEDAKKNGLPVNGYQVEQTSSSNLTINIMSNEHVFTDISIFLDREIKEKFDSEIVIQFKRVESIPREKSGKLRVIKRTF
jgi:phenylacetate-CoA ligase